MTCVYGVRSRMLGHRGEAGARTAMVMGIAVGVVLVATPGYAQVITPASSPSDIRAEFRPGNASTCGQVGLPDSIQMGAPSNVGAADAYVAGTVVTLPQGSGLNVAITPVGTAAGVVIDAVVVKGGNGHNVYRDPAVLPPLLQPPQVYISPINAGGNLPVISHWFLCYHRAPLAIGTLLIEKVV